MSNRNVIVHSNVESADLTAPVEMVLYDRDGAVVTLAADERLVFDSVYLVGVFTGTLTLFCDADDDNAVDAGEEVATFGGNISFPVGASLSFGNSPWQGQLGAKPHVISDASGDATASFTARVIGDEYG